MKCQPELPFLRRSIMNRSNVPFEKEAGADQILGRPIDRIQVRLLTRIANMSARPDPCDRPLYRVGAPIITSSFAFRTGSNLSITASITLKIAVFAPTPKPIDK